MQYKVLIKFYHGLGDHIQFTVVLRHLQKYRPNWTVDVVCGRGKHTAFKGLARYIYHDKQEEPTQNYDSIIEIPFWENYNRYGDRPNSKVTNCLHEVFGVDYDPELERYSVSVGDDAKRKATAYFESIGAVPNSEGRFNAFILHYEGNTSPNRKNLNWHQAAALCSYAKDLGLIPVIFDWDKRSPLPDQKTIFNPGVEAEGSKTQDLWGNFGSGDAEMITALISQASLFVGVDSGPGKCASATDTPTMICWKEMHPMQFHDPAPNTTHMLPQNWENMPPCENEDVRRHFVKKYLFEVYSTARNGEHALTEKVMWWMQASLGKQPVEMRDGMVHRWDFWMPQFHDLFCFWTIIEDCYHRDGYKTALRPKADGVEYVVDIGGNIGCFSRLWHERNPKARIASVEVHPALARALRENVDRYSKVFDKACYYEELEFGKPKLLDCLTEDSVNVGDSRIINENMLLRGFPQWYTLRDTVETITLEQLQKVCEFPRIDILKLDCEGSEINILRHCDLSRIGTIFVESHDPDQWRDLQKKRFQGWETGHMHKSEDGRYEIWHLVNPNPP